MSSVNDIVRLAKEHFYEGRREQALAAIQMAESALGGQSDLSDEVAVALCKVALCLTPVSSLFVFMDQLEAGLVLEGGSANTGQLGLAATALALTYALGRHELSVDNSQGSLASVERGVLLAIHLAYPLRRPVAVDTVRDTVLEQMEHLWCSSKQQCIKVQVRLVSRVWAVALVQCSRFAEARSAFSMHARCTSKFSRNDFEKEDDFTLLEAVVDVNSGDLLRAKERLSQSLSSRVDLEERELLGYLLLLDCSPLSHAEALEKVASLLEPPAEGTLDSPSSSDAGSTLNQRGVALAARGELVAAQVC
jgi:hypothetical protein